MVNSPKCPALPILKPASGNSSRGMTGKLVCWPELSPARIPSEVGIVKVAGVRLTTSPIECNFLCAAYPFQTWHIYCCIFLSNLCSVCCYCFPKVVFVPAIHTNDLLLN